MDPITIYNKLVDAFHVYLIEWVFQRRSFSKRLLFGFCARSTRTVNCTARIHRKPGETESDKPPRLRDENVVASHKEHGLVTVRA